MRRQLAVFALYAVGLTVPSVAMASAHPPALGEATIVFNRKVGLYCADLFASSGTPVCAHVFKASCRHSPRGQHRVCWSLVAGFDDKLSKLQGEVTNDGRVVHFRRAWGNLG